MWSFLDWVFYLSLDNYPFKTLSDENPCNRLLIINWLSVPEFLKSDVHPRVNSPASVATQTLCIRFYSTSLMYDPPRMAWLLALDFPLLKSYIRSSSPITSRMPTQTSFDWNRSLHGPWRWCRRCLWGVAWAECWKRAGMQKMRVTVGDSRGHEKLLKHRELTFHVEKDILPASY